MKHCCSFFAFLWLCWAPVAFGSENETLEILFQKGNTAVLDGRYGEAADFYKQCLAIDENGILHHNYGVVNFLNGNTGPAVLHLERASILGGDRAQTREVLSLIRRSNELNGFTPTSLESLAKVFPEWLWMALLLLSFWGFVFFGIYMFWMRKASSVFRDVAVAMVGICIVCSCAILGLNSRSQLGVFVGSENGLQIVPVEEEDAFVEVAPGELGRFFEAKK
jgi:hypothetical protein